MSPSSFAQIGCLEFHHLNAREVTTPLQSDQQLFDFIELHIVTCQPSNVIRKSIARRMDVRHMVLLGHLPNTDGDCAFFSYGH